MTVADNVAVVALGAHGKTCECVRVIASQIVDFRAVGAEHHGEATGKVADELLSIGRSEPMHHDLLQEHETPTTSVPVSHTCRASSCQFVVRTMSSAAHG